MEWVVELHDTFESELDALKEDVQDAILAKALLLKTFGPQLRRPHADTLIGSSHANMKELRCEAGNGVWRVAYAFDTERKAILLICGDKSGVNQKRFYKQLIARADARFTEHLLMLKGKHDG